MTKITIYQKPTCSTCREVLKLVEASGLPYSAVNYYEKAFGVLASGVTQRAFDIGTEPAKVREWYGRNKFGQSVLLGRRLEELRDSLVEAGVDPAALRSLQESMDGVAGRLERGLPGARLESELRSLSRRFADLGKVVDRSASEQRTSRTAGPFLPLDPPALPRRATAPRLDPEAALAPWRGALPPASVEAGRAYLERLAEEGVREPDAEGSR